MNRMRVVDIEWSEDVESMDGLEGYDGIQVLVRLSGRPVGYTVLPVVGGGCAAERLKDRILAEHGTALRDRSAPPPTALRPDRAPSITVAVCTRDNPAELDRCLAGLSALDYPRAEFLVVDNAPATAETRQLVESRYPQIRYVCEPRPGLNWARNRAIVEARSEILAYTDDDVVVDAGWLDALARAFNDDEEVVAVTGLVVPLELETPAQIYFERYGGFGCGFEKRRFSWAGENSGADRGQMAECGTGANMAFRRSVFDRIGPFDPALDVGTVTDGGGDLEMYFRVLKEGLTLVYEPAAVVRHRHRPDYGRLRNQIEGWGTGSFAVLARSAEAYPDERLRMVRLGIRAFWSQLKRLAGSLIRSPGFPRALLLAEMRGALKGPGRYRRARVAADEIARTSNVA